MGPTAEQCPLILIGDGANGKSTFVNVTNKLLGDYSKAASSKTPVTKGSCSVENDNALIADLMSGLLCDPCSDLTGAVVVF